MSEAFQEETLRPGRGDERRRRGKKLVPSCGALFSLLDHTTLPLARGQYQDIKMSSFDDEFLTMLNTPAKKTTAAVRTAVPKKDEEAHFDVAQNIYGATKDAWSWGKTVPVVSNVLGMTEFVALKALDVVAMDFVNVDDGIKTQVEKLDDAYLTPAISAVWGFVEPAVGAADDYVVKPVNEMVVKPVMMEVVPRVMMATGFGAMDEAKKMGQKKVPSLGDLSPTPELTARF